MQLLMEAYTTRSHKNTYQIYPYFLECHHGRDMPWVKYSTFSKHYVTIVGFHIVYVNGM